MTTSQAIGTRGITAHARWAAALGMIGLITTLGVAAATPAQAADTVITTSGTVETQIDAAGKYFDPGTEYVTIHYTAVSEGSSDYLASWERDSGSWSGPEEADAYLKGDRKKVVDCKVAAGRALVAANGVTTSAQFDARWSTGSDGWQWSKDENYQINDQCEDHMWDYTQIYAEADPQGGSQVYVPTSILPPGEHTIFIIPFSYNSNSGSVGLPECTIASFPDGEERWLSACGVMTTKPAVTSDITVVESGSTAASGPATAAPSQTTPSAEGITLPQRGFPIWMLILIIVGVIVLAGVIVTIILISRGRAKKNAVAAGSAAPGFAPYGQNPFPTTARGYPGASPHSSAPAHGVPPQQYAPQQQQPAQPPQPQQQPQQYAPQPPQSGYAAPAAPTPSTPAQPQNWAPTGAPQAPQSPQQGYETYQQPPAFRAEETYGAAEAAGQTETFSQPTSGMPSGYAAPVAGSWEATARPWQRPIAPAPDAASDTPSSDTGADGADGSERP